MLGAYEAQEAALQFFYDPVENTFYDEDGWPEPMIFNYVRPGDLKLFFEDGSYHLTLSPYGYYVELIMMENCYV